MGFPSSWSQFLFKLGDAFDPNNCMTIMIGYTFAKLYDVVFEYMVLRPLREG